MWSRTDTCELKESPKEPMKYSPFILLFPALCDVTATCLMYVGLTLTSASSFQMLRGSIMIFVGILSVIFLKKKLEWFRWFGMFIILVGLVVVGLSDFITVSLLCFLVFLGQGWPTGQRRRATFSTIPPQRATVSPKGWT